MECGLYEADLGGNVYKKRVAVGNRGKSHGARTIVATNFNKNKVKNKRLQDIYNFIFENKSLPHKRIAEMVKKKFERTYEYAEIGKIISKETKRISKQRLLLLNMIQTVLHSSH